jgi:hypothetical protein
MRNALCLAVLALAFAVPAAFAERDRAARRRGAEWRQPAEAGPRHVAALAVTAVGASSLLFATRGGFVAAGVRFDRDAPDALRGWTVSWPARTVAEPTAA